MKLQSTTQNLQPSIYETIIGLEIHVELSTLSKMFCRCKNPTLSDKPNTNTCPICLGLPGALPYTNQQAIDACVKIALALGCEINKNSFFERNMVSFLLPRFFSILFFYCCYCFSFFSYLSWCSFILP